MLKNMKLIFTGVYAAVVRAALRKKSIVEMRDCSSAMAADGEVVETNTVWLAVSHFLTDGDGLERLVIDEIIRQVEKHEFRIFGGPRPRRKRKR